MSRTIDEILKTYTRDVQENVPSTGSLVDYQATAEYRQDVTDKTKAALSAMVTEIIGEDEPTYETDGKSLKQIKLFVNNRKQAARQRAIAKGFTIK